MFVHLRMYYRRKISLALLEIFDNQLSKTDYQKLLMLVSMHQSKPAYEFVPYKYGCFSFLSYSDISTMIKYELIEESEIDKKWTKLGSESYLKSIRKEDRLIIEYIHGKFKNKLGQDLIKYTYRKHPYFAINSIIAKDIMNENELKVIYSFRKSKSKPLIATIGYEGITLEEYINRLIKEDIKVLVDVRKFPKSMKMGFSKNQLKNACNSVNIIYQHIPEVGIDSKLRKNLSDQKSYDELFSHYMTTLNSEDVDDGIEGIIHLLKKFNRIALTCFECDINQCHRKPLSEEIESRTNIKVKHI